MKYIIIFLCSIHSAYADMGSQGESAMLAIHDGSITISIIKKTRHALVALHPNNTLAKDMWVIIDTGTHTVNGIHLYDNNLYRCTPSPLSSKEIGGVGFPQGFQGRFYLIIKKPCLLPPHQKVNITVAASLWKPVNNTLWYGATLAFDRNTVDTLEDIANIKKEK